MLRRGSFSDPNTFVSDSGSSIKKEYSPHVNDDGSIDLVESGTIDIDAAIQSEVPLTDLKVILSKLERGDTSGMARGVPAYGDFTDCPSSPADALNRILKAEGTFNTLPIEVRDKFNNDYRQWFATAGSPSWFENMSTVLGSPVSAVPDPVPSPNVEPEVCT